MKKHRYEIIINEPSKTYKEFIYDFSESRGKGIKLQIANNYIRIIANLTALYETEKIAVSTNYIFSDAIKKSLLLHLLIHSKNIKIKNMLVSIDGEQTAVPIGDQGVNPPIYSLIVENLNSKTPQSWKNPQFLKVLLSKTRSNQDTRWNAVFAALCAKSKSFEIERFIYLWMTFNGIYNYYSHKINVLRPLTKKGKRPIPTEREELEWILQLYELGNESVKKDDSKKIANEVISLVKKTDISSIKSSSDISDELCQSIESVILKSDGSKYDMTAIGYLTVCFAYYFRCNVFHANDPLPLFCHADDVELKCLHLINALLENFIDEHLPKLFDDACISRLNNKFQLIANNK